MTRRRLLLLAAAAAAAVAVFAGLRLSANRLVVSRITSALNKTFGVDVAIDDLSLSLFSGEARVRGLRITDAGNKVIEADEIEFAASIRNLIGGTYDIHRLVVTRLVIHSVVEADGRTNFVRIFSRRAPSSGPAAFVLLRDARLVDGRYDLVDAVNDPARPAHVEITNIELALADLQVSGEPHSSELGDVRFDAVWAQAGVPCHLTLVGWARPLTDKPSLALHFAVTGLDLSQIPQYVDGSARFALGGDVMHLVGTMHVKDGVIEHGAMAGEVVATGTQIPLRFGGTMSDIVFDKDSKLAAMFHLPFAKVGRIGNVALTSTWGVARDLGSGLRDAGKSVAGGVADTVTDMVRLDPLGALAAAGGGVVGGLKAIGQGIIAGAKRIIAGGDSPAEDAELAAKQQVEFPALHANRRRAMLEAALESAKDGPGGRRSRIEKELADAPAAGGDAVEARELIDRLRR